MIIILFFKITLAISLTFICYIFIKEINKKLNKKIEDSKSNNRSYKVKISKKLENYVYSSSKFNTILRKKQEKLLTQNNVFNLTPITFYIIKFSLFLGVLIRCVYSGYNFYIIIGSSIYGFFILDVIYHLRNKNDIKEIKFDLPDIVDMLAIQDSAGVKLGVALSELYDIPSNPRFKNELLKLSAEIELMNNPEKALLNFRDKFDFNQIPELINFIDAILQALETGRIQELLDSQSEILKSSNVERIKYETRTIVASMKTIQFFATMGIIMFIGFCFLNAIKSGISVLFT